MGTVQRFQCANSGKLFAILPWIWMPLRLLNLLPLTVIRSIVTFVRFGNASLNFAKHNLHFRGRSKSMKVSSELSVLKEKEAGVLRVKLLYLGSSNVMEKFIRKSFQTAPKPRCKRSYGAESPFLIKIIKNQPLF